MLLLLGLGVLMMSYTASAQKSNEQTSDLQTKQRRAEKGSVAMRDRGRYIVKIGGCNDCHTDHYIESEGAVGEKQWLKGSRLGWYGPWGTTYAVNLRRFVSVFPEDQWVSFARTAKSRPPMPWWTLKDMNELDLRAIHVFVKYLGPDGENVPAALPPDRMPNYPYVQFPMPSK